MKKFVLVTLLSAFYLLPTTSYAQSVDLVWSGDGYVPPFYQGGAPWAKEGTIRFIAIPQGLGSSRNLFFKWSRNGTVLGNTNGVGVNTLSLQDSIFSKPQTIDVEILDGNENTLAQNGVLVAPRAPELLIYEKSPLYGFLFNQEISGGFEAKESEMSFGVFPFFFHTDSAINPQVKYSWQGSTGGESSAEQMVTYRVPDGVQGSSRVSITASNGDTLTETATKSFLIQFGNNQ